MRIRIKVTNDINGSKKRTIKWLDRSNKLTRPFPVEEGMNITGRKNPRRSKSAPPVANHFTIDFIIASSRTSLRQDTQGKEEI